MRFSLLSLLLAAAAAATAQEVSYRIERATSPIVIDARLDEPAWSAAQPVSAFVFNWYESGEKEPTEAKLLWDDDYLYVSWRATDKHISAFETKRHGPVSKDDCVEIFISPNPALARNYYTFEINAIGTMLNRARTSWWTGGPNWEPEGMEYRTTFHGLPKKEESPGDREWIVEAAIPFANFSRDAAQTPPRDGDQWRLNLQRLGGKTNAQLSTWSPIPPPSKTFHTPEAFGLVTFAGAQRQSQSRRGGGFRLPPPDMAAAREGREIYNRSCTMCHGLDGASGDRAPALGAQRRYLRVTQGELHDAIKNGIKGTMMPSSPLPDGDVRKIIAFINSLRATAVDVAVPGDVTRGESIFHGRGKCADCHMLRGLGGILGPDLSSIGGERKLDDIKAALTVPRPVVPRGFVPVKLRTRSGEAIEGVVKNENNFSLQVLGTDQKLHMVNTDEIATIRYESTSLMPSDVDKRLSADEFQDLLAFLSRQARGRR